MPIRKTTNTTCKSTIPRLSRDIDPSQDAKEPILGLWNADFDAHCSAGREGKA
ncbi:MAG: hypothetical protein ACKOH8_02240 [Gemmatimonadota bacterium]